MAGPIDTQVTAAQVKQAELVQFKVRMDGLKERLSSEPEEKEQLRKACRDFEAVFIGKLWEQMEKSVPQEGYLHSKQEAMYKSMFNHEFSQSMAEAGGIGLADMLYDQLAQKLKQASSDTLAANTDLKPLSQNGKPDMKTLEQAKPALKPLRGEEPEAPAEITPESFGPDGLVEEGSAYEREIGEMTEAMGQGSAMPPAADVSALSRPEVETELDRLSRSLRTTMVAQGAGAAFDSATRGAFMDDEEQAASAGRKLAKI